jgi:hypothetical protein
MAITSSDSSTVGEGFGDRVGAHVAACDGPLVSLTSARMSSAGSFSKGLLRVGRGGVLRSLSALDAHLVWLQLPWLLRSFAGFSGGQTNGGACRDIVGSARGAQLEGLVACEDLPAGDQDLAPDGGLGGFGFPWRCLVSL